MNERDEAVKALVMWLVYKLTEYPQRFAKSQVVADARYYPLVTRYNDMECSVTENAFQGLIKEFDLTEMYESCESLTFTTVDGN